MSLAFPWPVTHPAWSVLTRVCGRLHYIDHHVTRGSHYVECQLLGEEDDRNVPPFKIIGIFST